ncbi:Cullin-1 [Coprinopsis sp. MPI-PUGE-AT-0042]|nr:Cullin-1 [Coprinopsis sp. MPI-PUGE-AT-0042]
MASPSSGLQMPPPTADLVTTWKYLEEGVDHIMTKLQTGVSYTKYMSLYTVAYNYCTSCKMSSSEGIGLGNRTGANLMGSDLYNNLIRYFNEHLSGLRETADTLQDEALLRYYAAEWDRYTIGANYINRLFTYLNRHWVRRERDEGRKSVYPVYTLALVQWKTQLFIPLQKKMKLVNAILRLIENQRNGDTIDQGLVKKVVDSFVSLGLDEGDTNKECLDVYREHFEMPFLDSTEIYYKHESEGFLASNSVSDYLKKAEERLREEEDRVERYLNTSTRKALVTKCEHVLIRDHSKLMWENFQSLLDFDKDEDLQRMYALLSRIPEGLEPLRKKFEDHVKKSGSDAAAVEPKAYVDALLEVHKKNADTVTRSFRAEAGFVASLDKACREFGPSHTKSPELIAKHTDLLLRKNNKVAEEGDLEGALNRVMILFKYIEDKDVFQTFYSKQLSRRLIFGVSASEESEESMISKLKKLADSNIPTNSRGCSQVGNYDFSLLTSSCPLDVSLSKDLTDQFKARMEQNHDDIDVNFTVMVLGTNFWPLAPPTHEFILPQELHTTYDRFQRYYQMKHSGRKLTWLWNYCKNELRTNYTNQQYILMTSTFQTAILTQYNRNDTLSVDELVAATSIPKDYLSQVLSVLVKAKVLINEEAEQYDLNPGFKSKKIRVNLNLPIKSETKAESQEVLKTVDEDRKYVIQATIVRRLSTKVVSQISQRFTPKVPDIKKAIDTLLEKEYIERVEGTRDTFAYMA